MAKKLWSMSTTVRSPYRVKDFLFTLNEINNEQWDENTQVKFQVLLIKNRLYKPTAENLSEEQIELLSNPLMDITYDKSLEIFESKKYVDSPMRGRNSFAPLRKMGIANIIEGKIVITDLGYKLLNNEITIEEFSFMSLLKWQYPNPTSVDFKSTDGYNTKPFVSTLLLINEVNKLCLKRKEKAKGISKEELGIFVLSLINYKDVEETAKKLLEYRYEKDSLSEYVDKKAFREKTIAEYLKDFINASEDNIRDYADNAIRYFRLTKYIYIRGGGYYVDLEPRRMLELNKLFEIDNGSARDFLLESYIEYLSDYSSYQLPWKTVDELKKIALSVMSEINVLQEYLSIDKIEYKLKQTTAEIEMQINEFRELRTKLQNLQIKKEYAELEKINETIGALTNIRKQSEKASIALEKWTNIALNIINDAVLIKPNFPVGDDNEPTFTAPANVPDIECYYDNFAGICEVTMLTGRDQWYNEGQPVQRHLRDFEYKNKSIPSYCLFISPQLHRDTANTFWNAVKYEYEGEKQNIIPISISQLIIILDIVKKLKLQGKQFNRQYLKDLYDKSLNLSNIRSAIDWIDNIKSVLIEWTCAI